MFAEYRVTVGVLSVAVLTMASGCPLRKERITVTQDGTVRMRLEYAGHPEEIERYDALPSPEAGWSVTREIEKKADEEKETVVITGVQAFGPGEPLPSNLAEPGEPDADLVLQFPTSLTIERRNDGTYYTFRRVYTPRPWAYVQYWYDTFIDNEIEKLGEKPVDQLSRNEKHQIVEAFAGAEAFKQFELARIALDICDPDLRPEVGLKARRALLSLYEHDYDHFRVLLDRCEPFDQDEQDGCFEREVDRILGEGYNAYVKSLEGSGLSRTYLDCFQWSYSRAREYYDITKELGGHAFDIDIEMPGTVVAHNGDKEHEEGGNITGVRWQFDGKAFRDRAFELIVVSRVADDASSKRADDAERSAD